MDEFQEIIRLVEGQLQAALSSAASFEQQAKERQDQLAEVTLIFAAISALSCFLEIFRFESIVDVSASRVWQARVSLKRRSAK